MNILRIPQPRGHFVQLYDGDAAILGNNVAHYLAQGFLRDEGALVIATAEHRQKFLITLNALGVDTALAIQESRLLLFDAHRTLGEVMIDGQPDWERMAKVVNSAINGLQARCPAGIRAYGEMVGILWTAGEYTAAIRLEEFWNTLLQGEAFTLFCSYPIDIFHREFRSSSVDALLCDHTHLISNGEDGTLVSSILRAMDERLGAQSKNIQFQMKAHRFPEWGALPQAERMMLWLRQYQAKEAEEIAGLARVYYRKSECHRAIPA